MHIAEDIVKDGAVTGELFNEKLTEFVREHKFTKLIETGTLYGTGSTRAILRGLEGTAFEFISIECDPTNHRIARQNLGNIPGLHLINGITVGKSELPLHIDEDFPEFVITDHQPRNRMQKYLNEVRHRVPDHQLDRALAAFDYQPEFVLLDSAGHMGTVEFHYLISRVRVPFYLALDDTGHRKHYKTIEYIRANPDKYEILWEVLSIKDPRDGNQQREKFGSALIRVSGM